MRYAKIDEYEVVNGSLNGMSLYVQGCQFRCPNCFNTETWDFNGGKEWTKEVKEKFLELIDRPYIKRVSILGGECLAEENLDDVLDLVTEINKRYNTPPQKSIWLYTGYTWDDLWRSEVALTYDYALDYSEQYYSEQVFNIYKKRQQIIKQCDVLVDGQYIDSQRDITLKWRGSSNQHVINVKESLRKEQIILYCE